MACWRYKRLKQTEGITDKVIPFLIERTNTFKDKTMTIEILGIIAIIIMVGAYALEGRHPAFILVFAGGCALAAVYAFLINSYPFLIAEGLWALIALQRWRKVET